MIETLDLPEPGKTLFLKTHRILEEFLGEDWSLGGGTLLAGRWGQHRASTDVDVKCAIRRWETDRREWRPRLERKLREAGGRVEGARLADFVVYSFNGLGRLEISGRGSKLAWLGRRRSQVDGVGVWTERTSQVLAGKVLGRGAAGRPRDLFDLACAARHEPDELETALGALGEGEAQRMLEAWMGRRAQIVSEAVEEIFRIKPEWVHLKGDPAGQCARVVAGYAVRGMRAARAGEQWEVRGSSGVRGERVWGPYATAREAVDLVKRHGRIRAEDVASETRRLEERGEQSYPGGGDGLSTRWKPTLEVDAKGRVKAFDLDEAVASFGAIPQAVEWAVAQEWARREDGPYWERTLERERARALAAEKARTR